MYDSIFSSMPSLSEFQQLETLILYNIESEYLNDLLNQLQSLPLLSSLVITSSKGVRNMNLIYRQIFDLRALNYCKLSLISPKSDTSLVVCTNEHS